MKRNIVFLIIILWGAAALRAQEGQGGQAVELPSFVITGEEKFELPKAEKMDAQFVPVVSETFLKPVFSPEFLGTSIQSDPLRKQFKLQDTIIEYSSKLEASLGNFVVPSANFSTLIPYKAFTLFGSISGMNRRPYDDFTGRYAFHPELGIRFKVVQEGAFFNDNEITVKSGYDFTAYKLYALALPTERKPGDLYLQGNLASSRSNFWQYNINAKASSLQLTGEDASETNFQLELTAGFSGKTLEFNPGALYSGSTTSIKSVDNRLHFLRLSAPVQLNISDVLNLTAGLEFTNCDSITSLNPKVSLAFKMKKGIVLFGSFNPGYQVMHLREALRANNFTDVTGFVPVYYPESYKITAGASMEYERVFDLMISFTGFSSKTYPYFAVDTASRKYTLKTADIQSLQTSLDARMYPSAMGYFYANLTLQAVRDDSDKYLPFIPVLQGTFAYGYTTESGINGKIGVRLQSGSHESLENSATMKTYMSAFVEAGYSFSQDFLVNFKVNNLFNKENYLWKYYKEIPFDASAGVTLQW